MTHFIYIRHFSTEYSVKNLFMGRKDLPIISVDEARLVELAKEIERLDIKIIHSPLLRARQTVEKIIEKTRPLPIIEDELLIERDFGDFEGTEKTIKNRQLMENNPSSETLIEFRNRVKDFFSKYISSDGIYLIVGHSSFYRETANLFLINEKDKLRCGEFHTFHISKDFKF